MKIRKSELEKIVVEEITKEMLKLEGSEKEKSKPNFDRHGPDAERDKDGNRVNPKLKKEETTQEGVVDMDGETIVTGPDGDASPEARGLARQDDLQATMMKAAMEIKDNRPQEAYETLLRALAAAGIEGGERLPGLDEDEAREAEKRKKAYRGGATGKKNQGRYGY